MYTIHPLTEIVIQISLISLSVVGIVLYNLIEIKEAIKTMAQKTYNIDVSESNRFNAQRDLKAEGFVVTGNVSTGNGVARLTVKYNDYTDTFKIAAIQKLNRKK